MERDVFEIVMEKEFAALSNVERIELKNYCNTEAEYNQLKQVLLDVDAMDWTNPQPKEETKDRLDVLFNQTHPKVAGAWYSSALVLVPRDKPLHRQPLVQIAALALLVLLTVPFFKSDKIESSNVIVAENRTESDSDAIKPSKIESNTELDREVITETVDETIRSVVSSVRDHSTVAASREIGNEFLTANTMSAAGVSVPSSNHPDGVFIANEAIVYSLPASAQPADIMDLLTTTF